MTCCGCDIPGTRTAFGLFYGFPAVFFHSRMAGACPMTTDLVMRVKSVRTNNRYSPPVWLYVGEAGIYASYQHVVCP